jgi:hypothetical protein
MEVPLDGSITRDVTGDIREANNCRGDIREWNSEKVFASMGAEIQAIHGQILCHGYIKMKQISQNLDNFIFSILLKRQRNDKRSLKTKHTKGVWSK